MYKALRPIPAHSKPLLSSVTAVTINYPAKGSQLSYWAQPNVPYPTRHSNPTLSSGMGFPVVISLILL